MHNPTHEDKDSDEEWDLEADVTRPGSDNWIRMHMPRPAPKAMEPVVEETTIKEESALKGAGWGALKGAATVFRSRHRTGGAVPRQKTNASSQGNSDSQNSSISNASRSGTLSATHSSKTSKANDANATGYRARDVPAVGGVRPLRDHRAWVIRDEWVADKDEDDLRLAKVNDDKMRVRLAEEERQLKLEEEAAVAAEERRRNADALDTRPRNYELDGRIIWIQEPDPDLLPHVQAIPEIDIETKENDFRATVLNLKQLPHKKPPPPSPSKEELEMTGDSAKSPKNKRKKDRKTKEVQTFTDTFYKPDYMQPPVIETMKVRPGVVLACMGSMKGGPGDNHGRRMTRREYIQRTIGERPASADATGSKKDADGGLADSAGQRARPQTAPGGGSSTGELTSKADGAGAKGDVDLSTMVQSQAGPSAAKPLVFVGGGQEENSKAPVAPSWSIRNNGRALEMGARPPRFHVSPLGACLRSGPVQPPLGATMGHGLLRNGSLKDDYYFPSGMPSPMAASGPPTPASGRRPASAPMTRPASAPALPRGQLWTAATPGAPPSIAASPSGGGRPSIVITSPSGGAARPASASRAAPGSRPASAAAARRPASASGQGRGGLGNRVR